MSTPPHAFAATPRDRNELWGEDWLDVRALWPLEPSVDHLNHAAYGAVPIPALGDQQSWRSRMEENPVRFFVRELQDALELATLEVAGFLGAEPDGIAFVGNATSGISAALDALDLRPGDEIVVTDHGYGAVGRLAARRGAGVRVAAIELDDDLDAAAEAVIAELTDRTRIVVVDPVTSPTARRLPVDRVIDAAHRRDVPVLVDAAQATGMLDVSLTGMSTADFWTTNLHSWCCAPRGTGVLAVAPAWRERVRALPSAAQPTGAFPGGFGGTATADYTPWLAAPRALRALGHIGWERLRAHNAALSVQGQARVAAALGLDQGLLRTDEGLSMQVVPLPRGVAATPEAAAALQARIAETIEVEVGVTTWREQGFLRLSAHAYNAPSHFDRLCAHVAEIV